ncbi:unnamed protein product [Nezara viridula]|uniref:C3H1-type domain-containing protein n=1 Tax=Nezara viridula TaxID=85310 RepID=A0A9P0H3F1_NEZVI|nr:unnamed protein product [Nezara viridula]
MSKTSKRKSSEASSKNSKSLSTKDSHKRPSVFERLGTKATTLSVNTLSLNTANQAEFCRNWAQNGSCPYGKNCKLSYSHVLISPSKRSFKKDIDLEKRVQNSILCRASPSEVGVDWESWDQSELEYEDEKALERRRQLLQRELELQIKKEIQKQGTNKQHRSSSTSSETSSSSSSSSSSGSTSDSSLSLKKKPDQKSVSPTCLEKTFGKKNMGKGLHKESPPRKSSASKKVSPPRKPSRRKSLSPVRKPGLSPPSKLKATSSRSNDRGTRRNDSPIGSRGRTPDRKQTSRSSGSGRRSPRPSVTRRGRSPRPRPPSRNRSPDRRKEDDRKTKDDTRRNDRKTDFRDKREAAREKERVEALERCRERQREREALAKERERERKEREKRRRSYGSSRRSPPREEKRHDRKAERERSYSRERARDRALERVMERRGSSRERSYERPYSQNSPSYRGGTDRNRYGNERLSSERNSTRDDRRGRRWVESREKQSGSHEWSEHADWENRSSRCEERGDEWCSYSGSVSGNGDWRSRSHMSHHDDRRNHHSDKEKDHINDVSKGEKEQKEVNASSSSKRSGEDVEIEIKRSRLDEVPLQEELSDISDDPDDILNREDTEFMDHDVMEDDAGSLTESSKHIHGHEEGSQLLTPPGERNVDSRITEDDGIVSLDFEEISDEELEEESKCNKGVSVVDALGVDWASLVAEWRPSREISKKGSARKNWSSSAIFKRIRVSQDFAGDKLIARLAKKHSSGEGNTSNMESIELSSNILQNKQALSARADIIIRRQLCGLPVITSETHPTTGLCQWAV